MSRPARAIFPLCPTLPCRKASIGMPGTARRPKPPTTPIARTTGTATGSIPAGTPQSRASINSIWPAGYAVWTIPSRSPRRGHGSTRRGRTKRPRPWSVCSSSINLLMTFELTLSTPYMTRISQAVRNGDVFPHWPQCGSRVEIYGSEGVMIVGPHGAGWQVFARPRHEQPTLVERGWGKPVDRGAPAEFCRKRPQSQAAQCRCRGGAPQRPAWSIMPT